MIGSLWLLYILVAALAGGMVAFMLTRRSWAQGLGLAITLLVLTVALYNAGKRLPGDSEALNLILYAAFFTGPACLAALIGVLIGLLANLLRPRRKPPTL